MIKLQESFVVSKERCPVCASHGKDTRRDNLALYSDGHQYCFSCGFHHNANPNLKQVIKTQETKSFDFNIPEDATTDLPFEAMDFLVGKYHLTMQDIYDNTILWSPKMQWLIFPIKINSNTVGFQARNFNKDKPYKWYTKFPKKDHVKIFQPGLGGELILVEDIISAIRVSHIKPALPLFGSFISDDLLFKVYYLGYYLLTLWLDEDKLSESVRFAKRARELSFSTRILHTKLDPKCYTDTEIREILGG